MLHSPSPVAEYVYSASTYLIFLPPRLGATAGPIFFFSLLDEDTLPASEVVEFEAMDSERVGLTEGAGSSKVEGDDGGGRVSI